MAIASENLVGLIDSARRRSDGFVPRLTRRCLARRLREECSHWQVAHANSCFTRRVTCLRWHPTLPQSVAYGTHAGDIVLWDYTKPATDSLKIEGLGMGDGCITEMRFHPRQLNLVYTTAVDGKFSLQDFEGRKSEVCLDTMTLDYWWCSMDYSVQHGCLMVGDNRGSAVLMDMNTHSVIQKFKHLHKGKIKYMEFCPARDWMLVTTSVDRTVKFWDIRKFCSDLVKPAPLFSAEHNGLVSSAYFDPIYGTRLLTTAQNGEIRVYDSHDQWQKPTRIISHPHRNFQHMTDIKATWHPLYEDICVVGRYPTKEDPDKSRTVDLIDLESGEKCGCFYSPHLTGIIQLNQFSKYGECLASGMGYNGLIWRPQFTRVGHSGLGTPGKEESFIPLTKKRKHGKGKSAKEVPKKKLKSTVTYELKVRNK